MTTTKPSGKFFIRAVPAGTGFNGEFGFPGAVPDFVREGGARKVYDDDDEAIADAAETMCDLLNGRYRAKGRNFDYRKMGGDEFALALRGLDISPSEFAWLYGVKNQARVLNWIDGSESVPHPARVLLALLAQPGAADLARETTSSVTELRRPRR